MTVKIYLTHSEKYVIGGLTYVAGRHLEEAGLNWSGTPYQTANAKIRDRYYRTDSAVKLTEDEIGAIMCAMSVFGDDVLASVEKIDLTALNLAVAKISVAAEQRATGILGKIAMSNSAMRGRQSGYWGLQKVKPEAFR
jgi:hypothetical protein